MSNLNLTMKLVPAQKIPAEQTAKLRDLADSLGSHTELGAALRHLATGLEEGRDQIIATGLPTAGRTA
jgi:hypothetical protein